MRIDARALLSLLFTACVAGQEPSQATPTTTVPPSGAIAFARGGAIVLLDVATAVETVLVADNQYDRPLTWLPRGDRLLYWNHVGGAWDLWSVDPETKATKNLTHSARDNRSPAGSPDGRSIAFHRGGDGVWLMDTDGAHQRRLSPIGHRDAPPVWSPSSKRLAFTDLETAANDSQRMGMHVIEFADGKEPIVRALGQGEAAGFLDDTHLLAAAHHDGKAAIVVVDLTNGERRALTRPEGADRDPVLSPDRRHIAWVEWRGDDAMLRGMRSDGTEIRDLAPVREMRMPASFSPDGQWLTFESGADRRSLEVHIVAIGGGEVRKLTTGGGSIPVWRPATVDAREAR